MTIYWRLLLSMLLACAWGVALANEQCALSDGDTYAALPKDGPLPERGAAQIKKGQRYQVGPMMNGWIGVQVRGDFVWALAGMFATSCNPTVGGKQQVQRKLQPLESSVSNTPTTTTNINVAPTLGAGCPCGSGRVCVGPRGGQYCITSGGGKRYGR